MNVIESVLCNCPPSPSERWQFREQAEFYERLAASEEFRSAASQVDTEGFCKALWPALDFDLELLRARVLVEFSDAKRSIVAEGVSAGGPRNGGAAPTNKPPAPAEQMRPSARAIALLYDHALRFGKVMKNSELKAVLPDLSLATLYRDPSFKAARKGIKDSLRAKIPHGHKDAHGNIEAYAESE
jgi:hypothetical protein